jgi:plastocyanin
MRRILLAAFLAVPFGVACSSKAATCDTPTSTTTVDVAQNAFSPACVVATGTSTLSVVNHDDTPHTFTVKDTNVDVQLDAGGTAQAALSGIAPGVYDVICTYHPQMTETLQIT